MPFLVIFHWHTDKLWASKSSSAGSWTAVTPSRVDVWVAGEALADAASATDANSISTHSYWSTWMISHVCGHANNYRSGSHPRLQLRSSAHLLDVSFLRMLASRFRWSSIESIPTGCTSPWTEHTPLRMDQDSKNYPRFTKRSHWTESPRSATHGVCSSAVISRDWVEKGSRPFFSPNSKQFPAFISLLAFL